MLAHRGVLLSQIKLRLIVTRRHSVAEVTGNLGSRTNRADGVSTTSGAARNRTSRVELDVGGQVRGQRGGRATRGLVLFQRPLINSGVDLAHVVNASIGLGRSTRFHEVRNRDGREQADDGHNDHDFNQREARLTGIFVLFHFN